MISPKKYKSITKIHYKYRPKVCQKIRHSKIHYNIDKKKQKRREGGGGIKRILHSLSADFRTNFSAKMCTHQICVSKPKTSPPALWKAVFVCRIVSTKLCKLQSLLKTPARLNLKVDLRHFFDFFAHFCW